MQIGALPPVPRVLAVTAVKPDPFGSGEEQAAPTTQTTPPATPPAQSFNSVQMLVTVAAADPDRERRRQMAEDGRRGLDQLEALYTELLAGQPSQARLEQLIQWVRETETPEDPVLASIMSEIELRVRVELAKFDIEV